MIAAETKYGNGIDSDLAEALAENAVARERFDAQTAEERRSFLRRARQCRSLAEQKALVDELTGCEKGHGPYQL